MKSTVKLYGNTECTRARIRSWLLIRYYQGTVFLGPKRWNGYKLLCQLRFEGRVPQTPRGLIVPYEVLCTADTDRISFHCCSMAVDGEKMRNGTKLKFGSHDVQSPSMKGRGTSRPCSLPYRCVLLSLIWLISSSSSPLCDSSASRASVKGRMDGQQPSPSARRYAAISIRAVVADTVFFAPSRRPLRRALLAVTALRAGQEVLKRYGRLLCLSFSWRCASRFGWSCQVRLLCHLCLYASRMALSSIDLLAG